MQAAHGLAVLGETGLPQPVAAQHLHQPARRRLLELAFHDHGRVLAGFARHVDVEPVALVHTEVQPLVGLGLDLAVEGDAHVVFQPAEKRRALVDFIGTVAFLIPFCLLGLWVSTNFVLQSWGVMPDGTIGAWEISANADGLPPAPIKTMLIVGFGLLLLQAIAQAIKYLAIWLGYTQVAERLQADNEQLPLE